MLSGSIKDPESWRVVRSPKKMFLYGLHYHISKETGIERTRYFFVRQKYTQRGTPEKGHVSSLGGQNPTHAQVSKVK